MRDGGSLARDHLARPAAAAGSELVADIVHENLATHADLCLATCDAETLVTCGGFCEGGVCGADGCCFPECEGLVCGANGCGGECGGCVDGKTCTGDQTRCVEPWSVAGVRDGRGVAVDDTHIYYTQVSDGLVGRVKIDGTDQEFVVESDRPWAVKLSEEHVYIAAVVGGAGRLDFPDAGADAVRLQQPVALFLGRLARVAGFRRGDRGVGVNDEGLAEPFLPGGQGGGRCGGRRGGR